MPTFIAKIQAMLERGVFTGSLKVLNPYIVIIVTALLGVLVLFFIALPTFNSLPQTRQKIALESTRLDSLKSKNIKLQDLLNRQDALLENLVLVDGAIPETEGVPELLSEIEKIGSESGVTLRSMSFGLRSDALPAGAAAPKYKTVYVQAEAEGSYANLQFFLDVLETAARVIDIDNIRFTQEVSDEGVKMRATLNLVSFYTVPSTSATTDRPVTLDLNSKSLATVIDGLKKLKYYKIDVTPVTTGKANPFE